MEEVWTSAAGGALVGLHKDVSTRGGAPRMVSFEFLRVEATAMRIEARKTGDHTPIDIDRGAICALAGKVGICGDFMMRGTANMGPLVGHQGALATYAGVTLGIASW